MYKQTEQAFTCCVFSETEKCNECPLRDFGVTQLDCKTKLLRDMKNYVMQLTVDKEVAQMDANNFERTLEECNEERQDLEEQLKSKKVYEVKTDWATNDAQDCATVLYDTEEKAKEAFLEEIEQAKEDYSQAFDENGTVEYGWELEQGNNFWDLWEDGWYNTNHCTITITEKEIH